MPDRALDAQAFSETIRLRHAEARHRIVADITTILLDYVGPDEVEPLRRIVEKVTAALGDWCAFSLVGDDGILRQVAAYHPDVRQRELAVLVNQLVPPRQWDAGPEATNVLVQRRPLVFEEISDEMLRAGLPSDEAFAAMKEIGLASAILAPLLDGQKPLGTVILASAGRGGRRYTRDDVDFVVAIADRAALAVRNARLVQKLAEERDRLDRARAQAEERAAQMLAVFQADPNGIALFDANGVLRFVSPRVAELFGTNLEGFLGKHHDEAFRVDLRGDGKNEELMVQMRSIFADREHPSTDEFLVRKTNRWIRRSSTPVRSESGAYLGRMFVYMDVTAEKQLDRERSEFLTVAAHELRTPLTPLSMYLQGIERRLARGLPIEPELVVKARRQVGRLSRLVEDLLDVSRLESGRLTLSRDRVALDQIVSEVVSDFRAAAPQHEIVLRRPTRGVQAMGDRERLEQVVVNLVQNAIKYSPQGGRVEVSVERNGSQARVTVTDEGIGIPKDEQRHIFERFFRAQNATTRNYGGLGIGLYVSNEIVERHGGAFEVVSEPGKGTTFGFTIPLDESEPALEPGRARILVVDDDRAMLDATSSVLRDWGYAVDEAGDGETALRLLRAAKPDLMLVDLMMPVMDGWALVVRMRQDGLAEAVPLVVFSADSEANAHAKDLNAAAALRKPFSLEELQSVVGRLLPGAPPS
ncbi:MAG: ATP-binding protein [Myxococcales bacterium]